MEENEIIKLAQSGDNEAIEEIYNKYLKLLHNISRKFKSRQGFEQDDLFQIACVGFVKALNNFNSELGSNFCSYMYPWAIFEIKRSFRDYGSLIKHSRVKRTIFLNIYKMKCEGKSKSEISKELEITADEIQDLEKEFATENILSLDAEMLDGKKTLFIDWIKEPNREVDKTEKMYMEGCINELEKEYKEAIIRHFIKDEKQINIAESLSISQVKIQRRITKGVKMLRKKMELCS